MVSLQHQHADAGDQGEVSDGGVDHDLEHVQVVVDSPPPASVVDRGVGGAEDTLLLLNMWKEMKIKENKKAKVHFGRILKFNY